MDFHTLYNKLRSLDAESLPGQESQFKMMPSIRPRVSWDEILKTNPTPASVMLLVYPNDDGKCCIVLIQRNTYNGAHSAQISLPGGKLEEGEDNLKAALRETYEEIGVEPDDVEIITQMTKVWVSPSKFLVTPYLAVMKKQPVFVKDNHEVAEIIEVDLNHFFDDNCIEDVVVNSSYVKDLNVSAFILNDKIVWGATAMILSEFRDAVKELV